MAFGYRLCSLSTYAHIYVLWLLFGVVTVLYGQSNPVLGITGWQSFTSLLDARDVTLDRYGNLWVATTGGIFVAQPHDGSIVAEYRLGAGLLALDFRAIVYAPELDAIIAGAADGTLAVYSLDLGTWTHVLDIRRASDQYPRRSVNALLVHQGRLYVATDFGIVVYDAARQVPLETIDAIGTLPARSPITALTQRNDTLIVAGGSGVASISLALPSLRDRRLWRAWKLPSGISWSGVARGLIFDSQDHLLAADERTVFVENTDSLVVLWQRPASSSDIIGSISVYNSWLVISLGRQYLLSNGTSLGPEHPSQLRTHRTFVVDGKAVLVGCTASDGVTVFAESQLQGIAPNSLLSNTARDIAVDSRGNLWVATAVRNVSGAGFAVRTGQRWRIFTPRTDSRVPTLYYYRVAATPHGDVWLSSWGKGMLRARILEGDSVALDYYNTDNSPLVGFPSTDFTVPGGIAGDANGTMWLAHWGSWIASSAHLIAQDSSGRFYAFTYPGNPPGLNYWMYIAIDAAGTKWLGSYDASGNGNGLVWFNDAGTLDNTSDDRWGRITASLTGLPSNNITALSVDKTGMLWVGTVAGVAVIVNPSAVLAGSSPFLRVLRELRGIAINAIAIDALNNKWIATPTGIWIIADDGTTILGTLTTAQYPLLLSDEARALAADEERGIMYIATDVGINAVQTLSLRPSPQYELRIYPQPFDPERELLTIEGLAAETELRITTISGILVRRLRTRSRVTLWDGRDDSGELVSSGIYLLHAVSEQSGEGAVGKISVLRSGSAR